MKGKDKENGKWKKMLASDAVHVDKPEKRTAKSNTRAFVRGVSKCHSPIISEITKFNIEAN